ncbi:MAG: EAL domain-containing protein, partial [Pseudomonadota bacterium]
MERLTMENQHRLWVTALLGCLVFVVLLFLLDLPAEIKRGESGRVAIQQLDSLRRPFLEIEQAEIRLFQSRDVDSALRDFRPAAEKADAALARYQRLAQYNPELSRNVADLSVMYARWIADERHLFEHAREIARREGYPAALKHTSSHLVDLNAGFLNIMNQLGAGETPIHEDIERGTRAYYVFVTALGLLFFYLIGLMFLRQREKARSLQSACRNLQEEMSEHQRTETALIEKTAFLQMLQEITAVANRSATAEEAIQTTLDRVCAHVRWPVGHAYIFDSETADELVSMTLWHLDDPQRFEIFRRVTEATRFGSGVGLPGRVSHGAAPAWITDLANDPNFPRAPTAGECGLRAGFAFPVMTGTKVAAVLEFFTTETAEPNRPLLDVMKHVGTELGRVIERQRAEDRLQHLAHHDHLTGLPNRVLITDRLGQALARARYHKRAAAVFCLDLDRFSVINDTLGHDTGDLLLKAVAQRLVGVVRNDDTVARLGGDEFAILLVDMASEHDVPRIAQTVLEVLGRPFVIDGRELFITSSIGISLYPGDGDDAQTLMKHADVAIHRAKDRGKNNFHLYSPAMDAQAAKRLTLETQLRRAVEREEFILHYQPKLSLNTGRISGMEALARWQHPELGLVPPADFIPLLEETGLIVPVGEWVLHSACAQNLAWQRAGLPPMRVAVNLSTLQFKRQNMAKVVAQVLQQTGLEPKWLELEITESILAEQEEMVAAVLNELDAMDVRITIDDFGTGYSSLSYLKRFPIRVLKIDRSFVRDLTTDSGDAAITSAVIAMAHSLKISAI